MSKPAGPTDAQLSAIDHFAYCTGTPRQLPQLRNIHPGPGTYDRCLREGWLEEIDDWPYYRPTSAGRTVLANAAGGL